MTSYFSRTFPAFLAAGLCTLPGLPAGAQSDVSECLLLPRSACVETLNTGLARHEDSMPDPNAQTLARLQRVMALVAGQRPDLAEDILEDLPTETRDFAIVEIMAFAASEWTQRGQTLLLQIENPQFYSTARGYYIESVVAEAGLDAALQELEDTNRLEQRLGSPGVLALADALASRGRLQDALEIIQQGAADDEVQYNTQLNALVVGLINDGSVADAESILTYFRDPVRQSIATSAVAAALSMNGGTAQADAAFSQALATMAAVDSPEARFCVFDSLLRNAVDADRADWAVAAARNVSPLPADLAVALGMIVERGAGRLTEDQWRPIVHEAIALLEGQCMATPAARGRLDNSWSQLAFAAARAGDPILALSLNARISDPGWQAQDLSLMISNLIDDSKLQTAFDLLPRLTDMDMRAQGYILLAEVADFSGMTVLGEEAIRMAYALVDGSNHVWLSDETIGNLAQYEARMGNFQGAEMRIRGLTNSELQARAHIINLGFAAVNGSQGDFETYLAIVQNEIDAIPDVGLQHELLRRLAMELIAAGRAEPALNLAGAIEEGTAKDVFLSNVTAILLSHREFALADEAITGMSDPGLRDMQQHQVLLAALRASFSE